jgi:cobalamin synthase
MAPLASIKLPAIASVGLFVAVVHAKASFSEMVIGAAFIVLALLLLSGALHLPSDAERREETGH